MTSVTDFPGTDITVVPSCPRCAGTLHASLLDPVIIPLGADPNYTYRLKTAWWVCLHCVWCRDVRPEETALWFQTRHARLTSLGREDLLMARPETEA